MKEKHNKSLAHKKKSAQNKVTVPEKTVAANYISHIERVEKKKRNRLLLFFFLVLIIGGAGVLVFGPTQMPYYFSDSSEPYTPSQYYEQANKAKADAADVEARANEIISQSQEESETMSQPDFSFEESADFESADENTSSDYIAGIEIPRRNSASQSLKSTEPQQQDSEIRQDTKLAEATLPKANEEKAITVDKELLDSKLDSQKTVDEQASPSIENKEKAAPLADITPDNSEKLGTSKAVGQPKTVQPLISAEKMPSFPGGDAAMFEYLNDRIQYPRQAQDYEVEGKVYVQFVVDAEGNIQTHEVVKGLGYGCDEEALRIVKLMPSWNPGQQANNKVPVVYTLPISFMFN